MSRLMWLVSYTPLADPSFELSVLLAALNPLVSPVTRTYHYQASSDTLRTR